MRRKHQIQGQRVFYTGCFSKLLMRQQQPFSYPDYLLSGFSSDPVSCRGWGWEGSSLRFPALPSLGTHLVPACPQPVPSPAETPAVGETPEQGHNGTGCGEAEKASVGSASAEPAALCYGA